VEGGPRHRHHTLIFGWGKPDRKGFNFERCRS
jgi:hypothetical protein